MHHLDISILHLMNQFAQRSRGFDIAMGNVAENELLKGGLIMALFWWAWFRAGEAVPDDEAQSKDKELVLSGLVFSVATLFVARSLALSLPFRERPRYIPSLDFHIPIGSEGAPLIHWSSFPSDNAALFFSLATSLFLISRRLGVFAYCYALIVVCLPRIYLGYHYPSDILVGALLGIALASLARIDSLRSFLFRLPLQFARESPGLFYPLFFLATFLLASEFSSVRSLAVYGYKAIRHSI